MHVNIFHSSDFYGTLYIPRIEHCTIVFFSCFVCITIFVWHLYCNMYISVGGVEMTGLAFMSSNVDMCPLTLTNKCKVNIAAFKKLKHSEINVVMVQKYNTMFF